MILVEVGGEEEEGEEEDVGTINVGEEVVVESEIREIFMVGIMIRTTLKGWNILAYLQGYDQNDLDFLWRRYMLNEMLNLQRCRN
jgi:hypothetical protein